MCERGESLFVSLLGQLLPISALFIAYRPPQHLGVLLSSHILHIPSPVRWPDRCLVTSQCLPTCASSHARCMHRYARCFRFGRENRPIPSLLTAEACERRVPCAVSAVCAEQERGGQHTSDLGQVISYQPEMRHGPAKHGCLVLLQLLHACVQESFMFGLLTALATVCVLRLSCSCCPSFPSACCLPSCDPSSSHVRGCDACCRACHHHWPRSSSHPRPESALRGIR